jgi:prevent-host-death family protein
MNMSAAEAKAQFSAVLERAAAGEEVTITKHGKPIAKIVSVSPAHDGKRARRLFDEMVTGRTATLGGLKIKDLIEEGRM